MQRPHTAILSAFVLLLSTGLAFGQAEVSEKKEIAIFQLGYSGWAIPLETLSTIDIEIQRVFLDLGRFSIFGMEKRFATRDVDEFIRILKGIKERTFELPEKYQFYESFLTEAEFERLIGAFIIAVPVVTSFDSQFVNGKEWQTNIKTNVSFIDVASGKLMGIANVESSGTSRETQYKSIQSAIDGIPMTLQYEIRKIPEFQISTGVLGTVGGEIKIQLGSNMGIKPGDEYKVVVGGSYEGFKDEREVGLILIKEVGPEVSTGIIRYSSIKVDKGVQLREIPRLGVNMDVYAHSYTYLEGQANKASSFLIGARFELTRGVYDVHPYLAVQVLADLGKWLPLSAVAGAQYCIYARRLEFGIRGGLAAGSNALIQILNEEFNSTDDPWFTHVGVSAGAYLSYLVTRDLKVFAEVQADYLFGILTDEIFGSYGGYQIGAGVSFKL